MRIFPHQQVGKKNALVEMLDAGISVKAYLYLITDPVDFYLYRSRCFIDEFSLEIGNHGRENKGK
jgi:hypothetical protein